MFSFLHRQVLLKAFSRSLSPSPVGRPGHGQPGPDGPTELGPKISGRAGSGLHIGPGSGLTTGLNALIGPGSGLQKLRMNEESGRASRAMSGFVGLGPDFLQLDVGPGRARA